MNFPLIVARDVRPFAELAAMPVLAFVSDHQVALWHAANLLGGFDYARLVDRLVDDLRRERRLTQRVRIRLDQVVALLTLEHVGDPERSESGHFASIDPCDPVVEEICVLSDGLRAAMEEAETIARTVGTKPSAAFAAA